MPKRTGGRVTSRIRALFYAQRGLCFHCNTPMREQCARNGHTQDGWTREHVYPRSTSGRGLANNFVLAHPECNNRRGNRHPTEEEILRTRMLYAVIGETPFVPDRGMRKNTKRIMRDMPTYGARGCFVTLGDVLMARDLQKAARAWELRYAISDTVPVHWGAGE